MNFIGQWFLENKKVCDDLIDFYERSTTNNQALLFLILC